MATLMAPRPRGLESVPLEARMDEDGRHATLLEDDTWHMFLTRGVKVPGVTLDGKAFLPDPDWVQERRRARLRLEVTDKTRPGAVIVRTPNGTCLPLPATRATATAISETARAIWHARRLSTCVTLADGRTAHVTVWAGRLVRAQVDGDATEAWIDSETLEDLAREVVRELVRTASDHTTADAFRDAESDLVAAAARTKRLPDEGTRTRRLRALSVLESADHIFHMLMRPVLEHDGPMADEDVESLVRMVGPMLHTYRAIRDDNGGVTVRDAQGRAVVRLSNGQDPRLTAHPRYGADDNEAVADAIVEWCETTADRHGCL